MVEKYVEILKWILFPKITWNTIFSNYVMQYGSCYEDLHVEA